MVWNWQQTDWPEFTYDAAALESFEKRFLLLSGKFIGAYEHIRPDDRETLRIELIGDEALKTSEIEGEIFDRDSLQSSLRRQFGLGTDDDHRVSLQERGIAQMMVSLYQSFADPLTHESLYAWHDMVMSGARRIQTVGGYRMHSEPMQIVSGPIGRPRIHFEAPPSATVFKEMDGFVSWFNRSAPDGAQPLSALTRAGMAHLYFESIHPFEDGNGRIGRALSEKALAQNLDQPTLISLAYTIERGRKRYYQMLQHSNKNNRITDWLVYFAETALEAQQISVKRVNFYIAKARFYERLDGRMNPRQEKVIARMFREGLDGFKGGLSARNYISITNATRATATRDLHDLVEMGALTRTGVRRYTRYHLNIDDIDAETK